MLRHLLPATLLVSMAASGCANSARDRHGRDEPRDAAASDATLDAAIPFDAPPRRADAGMRGPVDIVRLGTGVPADAPDRFVATTTDPGAPRALYPLEGAMMPANAYPPTVQWSPSGAMGDLLRITASRGMTRVTAYVLHTGPGFGDAWQMDAEAFAALASDEGDVRVELARWDSSSARALVGSAARTFHIARGRLYGAVYYWDLDDGRTLSIAPGTAESSVTVADPPADCMSCHTVSRDGTRVWASNPSWSFAYDLTTTPPSLLFGETGPTPFDEDLPSAMVQFGSYSPDGRHLVGSFEYEERSSIALYDGERGDRLPVVWPAGTPSSAMFPAWSPDGARLAFSGGVDVAWTENPSRGDLYVMDVASGPTPTFTNARRWIAADSLAGAEGGQAIAHPTWSPTSDHLVFQRGGRAFSSYPGRPDRALGPVAAALYLVGRDETTAQRLDRASDAPAFWPTLSPFLTTEAEGHRYLWVAFFSRRDYGNSVVGTMGTERRQLWVSAIDIDASGVDPSFTPYWLPGQSTTSHNAAAYWAAEACRPEGETCEGAAECCSSLCAADPDGALVCMPPPPEQCRQEGERCGGTGECCDGFACQGNACVSTLY